MHAESSLRRAGRRGGHGVGSSAPRLPRPQRRIRATIRQPGSFDQRAARTPHIASRQRGSGRRRRKRTREPIPLEDAAARRSRGRLSSDDRRGDPAARRPRIWNPTRARRRRRATPVAWPRAGHARGREVVGSRRALRRRHRFVRDGRTRRRWRAGADERRAADRQPDALSRGLEGHPRPRAGPRRPFGGNGARGFWATRSDGIGGGGGDLPSRADGGAAFDRGRRHCRIWGGPHANPAVAGRLFRAGAGRPSVRQPRCRRGSGLLSGTRAPTASARARGVRRVSLSPRTPARRNASRMRRADARARELWTSAWFPRSIAARKSSTWMRRTLRKRPLEAATKGRGRWRTRTSCTC